MPKLVVFRGDTVENEIRLTGATVRIGRDNRNEVVLDDSSKGVSRFHAEVRAEGGRYFVVDLKSRNGVWISGRRIKDKAELSLGLPVTLGSYELTLEDDFDEDGPLLNPHTGVYAASVHRRDGHRRSATGAGSMRSPATHTKRQRVLLWSAVAIVVLSIGVVAWVVIRNINRPMSTVAILDPPPPPPPLAPAQPLPDDPKQAAIEQHLAEAQIQMGSGNYVSALRDHLEPVLDLDPENTVARELSRQAKEELRRQFKEVVIQPPLITGVAPPPPPPTPLDPPETPGIPRRTNETWADYSARVKRIQSELSEGKSRLEKQEFAAAITNFRSVERDQPKYQGVDSLIADAINRQQKALDGAIDSGRQNERAGKWRDARQWYWSALSIDPASTTARERELEVRNKAFKEADAAFNAASLASKMGATEQAARKYHEVVALLLDGDELREKALKQLELLKR